MQRSTARRSTAQRSTAPQPDARCSAAFIHRALRRSGRIWLALARPSDTYNDPGSVGTRAEVERRYGRNCEFDVAHMLREDAVRLMIRHDLHVDRATGASREQMRLQAAGARPENQWYTARLAAARERRAQKKPG